MPAFARSPLASSTQSRLCIFIALLGCALGLLLARAVTFHEPLERDLSIYAVAAHELLAGRPLYSDIWDIKPPAIYLAYAAGEMVAGYGANGVYFLGALCGVATLFGIYSTVKILSGDVLAGLWAGFFWVLVSGDMRLQANQPNTEVFINALLVAGIALWARAYRAPSAQSCGAFLWGAGCLWAGATFFKQVAFLVPFAFALAAWWQPPRALGASKLTARVSVNSLALIAPSFALWGLVFGYFWATGRAAIFGFTLVEFGRTYAQEGARVVMAHTSFWRRLAPPELFFLWPLLLLVMLGLRAAPAGRLPRFWGALLLYALAVQGAIILPGQYYPHYYQLWLPVLTIGAGLGLSQWRAQISSEGKPQRAPFFMATAATLLLFVTQWPNWNLSMDEFSSRKYDDAYFARLPETARYLDVQLLPGENFYQMGFDAGLYLQTRRRPPVGVLCLGSPYLPPLPPWFQTRIITDLEREKPEMAVVDSAFPPTDVTRYLQKNYVRLPDKAGPEQLIFMARRGGALLRRRAASGR